MVLGFFKKKEDKETDEDIVGKCIVCNKPVKKTEDYKVIYFQGQKLIMHKKCFKEMKKLAKQFLKGGLSF